MFWLFGLFRFGWGFGGQGKKKTLDEQMSQYDRDIAAFRRMCGAGPRKRRNTAKAKQTVQGICILAILIFTVVTFIYFSTGTPHVHW